MDMPVTRRLTTITGYACACPQPDAPTRPAVVLDPFGGTGTTALVRPIVLGWSPPGVCTACGHGRRPVSDRGYDLLATRSAQSLAHRNGEPLAKTRMYDQTMAGRTTITGYACACPQPDAPTRPSLVVDPFGGTGTTALVATVHGRHGITVDASADYCRLAAWRCHDPGERARALDVPKPPPIPEGQDALFALPP